MFNINPKIVRRYLLGGALVGGGSAAIVELLHSINVANEARKLKKEPTSTDKHTIVLTLPSKKTAKDQVKEAKDKKKPLFQRADAVASRSAGDFGVGWPTNTASVLAAILGTAGGATLVSKLMERQRRISLRRDVDQAREEYLDLLSDGMGKYSSFVDELIPSAPGMNKEASRAFGFLSAPMTALAVMSILGSAGAAYITKRVLDINKQDAVDQSSKDRPKVQRIVFRSAPKPDTTDVEEQEAAELAKVAQAGFMVMLDAVGRTERFIGHPTVKEAAAKEGVKLAGAEKDWDHIMGLLQQSPETATSLARLYSDYTTKNPVMRRLKRTAIGLPGFNTLARRKLMTELGNVRYGSPAPQGAQEMQLPQVADNLPDIGVKTAQRLRIPKSPPVAVGTFIGSAVGASTRNKSEIARTVEKIIKEKEDNKPVAVDENVQIAADDEEAKTYIVKNRGKIERLVKRLAVEGQI